MAVRLLRLEFEVFGKVQGVFFRKFTKKKSEELGLKGWCMNTDQNTVRGIVEGAADSINVMKKWLREEGSPNSKIENAIFNEKSIAELSFHNFEIRR